MTTVEEEETTTVSSSASPPGGPPAELPPLPKKAARWVERDASKAHVAAVTQASSLPEPAARVLVGRGVTDAAAAQIYLDPKLAALPDPMRLAGMDAALARTLDAIKRDEIIGIFGDYDVDGVTSTVLLDEMLRGVGARTARTIPDRLVEGYGLSKAGVDRMKDAGASLLITVDCGVTAHEEIAYANGRGLDVVVIDHHTVPVTLPEAVAVINPHRADCTRGSEMLCAVGVTFNLAMALRRALRERGHFSSTRPEPDLKSALDLVALGTVADVVPLVGENRVLVANGLKLLRAGKRKGLQALLDVAGVAAHDIDAGTLGFQLGPRVNAAGRLGDAMQAVALLTSDDDQHAHRLAVKLDRENSARRELEKRIVEQAIRQVEQSTLLREAPVVVVHDESWHPGVVGIVASRLVERFGRPSVVIGDGGRGSGRSIERFHLFEALSAVSGTLAGFGGHAHAAGVRTKPGGVEAFRTALIEHATRVLRAEDLQRVIVHDGPLAVSDVDFALCRALESAAPFGRKNPEPLFLFEGLNPTSLRELGGGHVKAVVDAARGVELIAFGARDRLDAFRPGLSVLATPEVNTWRNARALQLRVRDIR